MKVLTVTVESSMTKNLGNYQSTRQIVSITLQVDIEVKAGYEDTCLNSAWRFLNDQLYAQMVAQIKEAELALDNSNEKEF